MTPELVILVFPPKVCLKQMRTFSCAGSGAVRDALTEWNTHVSWQWSSEFRRFWNSMRRLDKLLVRSMLQWKRLLSRSLWFHHAASSRARNRVAPSYVRSSFYGWEKVFARKLLYSVSASSTLDS